MMKMSKWKLVRYVLRTLVLVIALSTLYQYGIDFKTWGYWTIVVCWILYDILGLD
jgi:hypothetical protein